MYLSDEVNTAILRRDANASPRNDRENPALREEAILAILNEQEQRAGLNRAEVELHNRIVRTRAIRLREAEMAA